MARPKLNIDAKAVLNYARLGCTNVEIAGMFGCDEGTIRKRFSEELTKGRADRHMTLRQWQWDAAKKGNVTMMIWLGKNELKQSDSPATTPTDAVNLVEAKKAKPPAGAIPPDEDEVE